MCCAPGCKAPDELPARISLPHRTCHAQKRNTSPGLLGTVNTLLEMKLIIIIMIIHWLINSESHCLIGADMRNTQAAATITM